MRGTVLRAHIGLGIVSASSSLNAKPYNTQDTGWRIQNGIASVVGQNQPSIKVDKFFLEAHEVSILGFKGQKGKSNIFCKFVLIHNKRKTPHPSPHLTSVGHLRCGAYFMPNFHLLETFLVWNHRSEGKGLASMWERNGSVMDWFLVSLPTPQIHMLKL